MCVRFFFLFSCDLIKKYYLRSFFEFFACWFCCLVFFSLNSNHYRGLGADNLQYLCNPSTLYQPYSFYSHTRMENYIKKRVFFCRGWASASMSSKCKIHLILCLNSKYIRRDHRTCFPIQPLQNLLCSSPDYACECTFLLFCPIWAANQRPCHNFHFRPTRQKFPSKFHHFCFTSRVLWPCALSHKIVMSIVFVSFYLFRLKKKISFFRNATSNLKQNGI